MKNKLSSLIKNANNEKNIYRPIFYRLSNVNESLSLEKLINKRNELKVYDEILGQVEELIKLRNPKVVFSRTQLKESAIEFLNSKVGDKWEEFGVWVYYPWSNRLVHLLDESEFIEVRTNRNLYKITPKEKEVLSNKKIGVIGLSVGQSIAVTLAQERSFGELRIADFDVLELSNFNRIRTGLFNLGINKSISVAREISEIDPFLKVVPFEGGISEENLDDFFVKDGKLDLVIDECDGLNIKILCRYKARELKIPVFMESSDRGTIDVERYDLDPSLPILHGLIDHLDHKKLKDLKTNEEKVPYILPMLGTDTISKRMRASMVEIEQTITTWPQLASAVVFGGGLGADVCRRILLNYYHESGRYIIDLEELIGDKKSSKEKEVIYPEWKALSIEDMKLMAEDIKVHSNNEGKVLNNELVVDLVKASILAPSVGNNQPWKFLYEKDRLFLFHDKARTISFGDFDEIGTNVALGACIENLTLKANQLGLKERIEYFPYVNKQLTALFTFNKSEEIEINAPYNYLVNYIERRCTNRSYKERRVLNEDDKLALINIAATIPGAKLNIIQNPNDLEVLKEVISIADRLRFMHPWGHNDFYSKEIRWTREEAEKTKDGLLIDSFDLKPSEKVGMKISSDPEVIKYLNNWEKGTAFEKMARKAVDSASAIGFLTMPEYNSLNYLMGGRSVQRVWLEATKRNLSIHPLLAPLFMFARLVHGNGKDMPDRMILELTELRKLFKSIFNIEDNQGEIFLFKISHGTECSIKSLRLPVTSILTVSN